MEQHQNAKGEMYDGFPLDDEVNVRVAEESITHGKLISVLVHSC
jgi:hypothetical protein